MLPEEKEKKQDNNVVKALKLLLKIGITALCFWYISTRIDFGQALKALTTAKLVYLLAAFLFFILSKIIAAIRLNLYFRDIGVRLSAMKNFRLYWLGMFYNLFLPGAISGDAYKIILLNRAYKTPYKKGSAAVLLDRFSGVVALGLIGCFYGIMVLDHYYFDVLLIAAAVLGMAGFYAGIRFMFPDFLRSFGTTFLWGLGVQIAQVICVYFILLSLDLTLQPEWIFIFLASAVISILPVSLGGGLGTREVVFAEGARFFHLDPQTGVVISLLFYLITVAGSLPGLYYIFHDPLKTRKKNDLHEGGKLRA